MTGRMRLILLATVALAATWLLDVPGQAQTAWHQSARPDGSMIDWALDLPTDSGPHGLIVLAQGSGCQPVAQNHNISAVRHAFAGYAALTIEKYGVPIDAEIDDPYGNCPASFHAHNTASQRLADYTQIIAELETAPWWDGTLVLFGGSMGGSVMARLAPSVDADAAILLSTGGGMTFGEMVAASVPEEVRPQLELQFAEIRKHPDSTEVWSGSSFRFWADALDRGEVDDMLQTEGALLLIQGGRDTSSPVANARIAADRIAMAERTNLTYWEYPGYDHGMADADGISHMDDVIAEAADWLQRVLGR